MAIDISKEIQKILDEETQRVREVVNNSVEKVADAAVKELKDSSPKKSGKYAKSWKKKESKLATGSQSAIIHNEKHYRLTHLLEFGHATVNGGRVAAHPHIASAEQKVIKDFEEEIRRGIEHG